MVTWRATEQLATTGPPSVKDPAKCVGSLLNTALYGFAVTRDGHLFGALRRDIRFTRSFASKATDNRPVSTRHWAIRKWYA